MTIRLMLVDDHEVVRSGLRMLLEGEPDVEIVGEFGLAKEALASLESLKPDVVVMDIGLPDLSGIDAAREVKRLSEGTAVVALTIHEDEEYFFKMLDAGASGYVPKRAAPEELLTQESHAEARGGMDGLTDREQEVLAHLADGATNLEIGETLGISPKTVARHRENIMRKLGMHSRTELVKYAIRKGIIQA